MKLRLFRIKNWGKIKKINLKKSQSFSPFYLALQEFKKTTM
jgi:hypothetical protein